MSRFGELDLGDLGPAPSVDDWFDQAKHQDPDLSALAGEGDALLLDEAQRSGPPAPEPWGELDHSAGGGRGGGGGAGATEAVVARVALVAGTGTGLTLLGWPPEDPGAWVNVSRYRPVDLSGVQPGDEVELTVERGRNGRYYLASAPVVLQKRPEPGNQEA
jgi:hypothetical protein